MTSLWTLLAAVAPGTAQSFFALACALLVGTLAWLAADAVRQRLALRPALTAIVVTIVLAPAGVAFPLWLGLLAGAAMLAAPEPRRLIAANDNDPPERWSGNPFSLAA